MANPDEFARTPEQQARGRALCLAEADRWRRQAAILRDCATQAQCTPDACATMLRNAARCDGDAAYWEAGARECEA